ncbi:molybdate transport system substrate-binding protein [Cryobacterium flavum]|uniref:ABC transporter substrate-binding protein n=1 Tax=Cryobacterium flavum TaxID=1424659 RepID=A0A4R8V3E7_9MICO|nr:MULTISPECIES: substrate-binding domain-containing protein [Cryobacterium]TFB75663.1 ABC transporter substrate-binding protein [Cryobacterium flavum]TFD08904.1 ABC transporter substrate-binding protein [Cryobacterium sp. TMT1-2-2]TFD10729.1 ABC transporter substrate-binding protein [Cryobacterium sp. TMT1-66-1]SDN79731.1 molybdate transport system substrate-binding protein [Cryobacterium flavum]
MSNPIDTKPSVVLFSGLATQKALEAEIFAAFTTETGIAIDAHFDPTTELQRRFAAGERPDIVIVATPALASLAADGVIDPSTVVPLVTTGIGIGVADGADKPDISTVPALTSALRNARSVAYSQAGQSGIYFRTLIERLGIAAEVDARATPLAKGFTGVAVRDGRADLAVQQLSELAFVPGIAIVGPFPDEVQHLTEFAAALSNAAAAKPEALALLEFLNGDVARAAYERSGLRAV